MITSVALTEALLQLHNNGHALDQGGTHSDPLERVAQSVSVTSTDGNEGRDAHGLPINGVDATAESLQRPRLFLDLRPFMDIAPPIVQCVPALQLPLASMHLLLVA